MSVNVSNVAPSQAEIFATCVERVSEQRDKTAFIELFDFFAPRLKSYLIRRECSPALAEEITQDVMLSLWRKAHLFDRTKSSVSTWLFRIARNRRIDLIRRDKSDRLDANDPTMFPTVVEIDQGSLDARECARRVRLAIDMLPKEQAVLVRLSFFDGKPHGQIASELDMPLGTVKSRLRLAFTRLRKTLEQDEKVVIS